MLIQLETQSSKPKPRSVFYSYSHKDEDLRDELDTHLKLLKQDGFISTWHDRKIRPGDEWDHVINDNLNSADVILFLVSHHFLASQYCRDTEVKRAMERYQNHEAILVPIIIKPCVWTSQEFAKLQVLPKNCRPISEWPESGFAQVAEDLRIMLVDMLYPQRPADSTGGHHGSWIIKMRTRPEVDSNERAQQVVKRLREYTEDYSINLQATASAQIIDGKKTQIGQMLILTGSPEAFSIIDKLQRDGKLSSEIDDEIISLYVTYGATVQGSSSVGAKLDIAEVESQDLLLRAGRKLIPPLIKTLTLQKDKTGMLNFLFDNGNMPKKDYDFQTDIKHLMDYFKTSLAVSEDLQWVNLSAYEADRMLPKELSGTIMGRNLLAQDCMLKRLTASYMHPDSPVGREYWNEVYMEARRLYGSSRLPFHSFQKVWILPGKATVYEEDGDISDENSILKVPKGQIGCLVVEAELDVKCEVDLIAQSKLLKLSEPKVTDKNEKQEFNNDFSLDIFRRIVLPKLKEEVNEGEHFKELRQIYNMMILSTWVKNEVKSGMKLNPEFQNFIDSGKPTSHNFSIINVESSDSSKSLTEKKLITDNNFEDFQLIQPNEAVFDIPENVEFYKQYVKLFKNGIFRCARNEVGDSPDERIIRIYFSGAIDFRNLKEMIKM